MIKKTIDEDEWYPVLIIDDVDVGYGKIVEIPQELIDRFVNTRREFNQIQYELWKIYDPEEAENYREGYELEEL